jgi:hypothetical protein
MKPSDDEKIARILEPLLRAVYDIDKPKAEIVIVIDQTIANLKFFLLEKEGELRDFVTNKVGQELNQVEHNRSWHEGKNAMRKAILRFLSVNDKET